MKKALLFSLIVLTVSLTALQSQESQNSEYYLSNPVFSDHLPKLNASALLIPSSEELIAFFKNEGLEADAVAKGMATDDFIRKVCSICKERQEDFCIKLQSIVRKYMNPHHSAYVLQYGNIFWTIYS